MSFLHRTLPRVVAALALAAAPLLLPAGCAAPDAPHQGGPAAGSRAAATPPPPSGPSDFETASSRPPTAQTLFTMARILQTQGKESEAEYVLRKIIRTYPAFMPAYCDLAETLLRQRRIEEAVATLDVALRRAPRDAVLVNDQGMCDLLRARYPAALEHFTRATALAPDDARYRGNMAVALGMMGRYPEALALYEQILPAAEAHYNLAILCDARHDAAHAAEEYRVSQALRAAEAKARPTPAHAEAAAQPARQAPPRQARAPHARRVDHGFGKENAMQRIRSNASRGRKRHGILVVWVALFGIIMIAMAGLALDTAWVYLSGHQLQNVADAAALAGALRVRTSSAGARAQAITVAAANKAGGTAIALTDNPGNTAGFGDIELGTYDKTNGFKNTSSGWNAIKVTTRRTAASPNHALPLNFGPITNFFGGSKTSTSDVTRYAVAQIGGTIGAGLVVLSPTANPAIQLTGTGSNSNKIVVNGGSVVVDSTSSNALSWNGHPYITADSLYITGNDTAVAGSGVFPSGHLGINSPPSPDPLAALAPPAKPGAPVGNTSSKINPGYYSGGLPTGKNVVMTAGVYYVDGGLSLGGNDNLDATAGVMIYIHTGSVSMGGNASFSIKPPISGPYAGISIYMDRGIANASFTMKGTSGAGSGTFYLPTAAVSIQGTPSAFASQLICNTLDVQGNAQLTINYNGNFAVQGHDVYLVK